MGAAASSDASQEQHKEHGGRHTWHRRRASGDGAKRGQSPEKGGMVRRVRSKTLQIPQEGSVQAIVSLQAPQRSKSAAVAVEAQPQLQRASLPPACCASSPEVRAVFEAATLPVKHLSVRTHLEPKPGERPSGGSRQRKPSKSSSRPAPACKAAATVPQVAQHPSQLPLAMRLGSVSPALPRHRESATAPLNTAADSTTAPPRQRLGRSNRSKPHSHHHSSSLATRRLCCVQPKQTSADTKLADGKPTWSKASPQRQSRHCPAALTLTQQQQQRQGPAGQAAEMPAPHALAAGAMTTLPAAGQSEGGAASASRVLPQPGPASSEGVGSMDVCVHASLPASPRSLVTDAAGRLDAMSISASDDAAGPLSPEGGHSARSTGAASAPASSGASTAATVRPSTFAPAAASPSKEDLQLPPSPSEHAPAPQAQVLSSRRPPRTPVSAAAGSLRRQSSAASGLGKAAGGASSPPAAAVTPPSATLTGLSGLPAGCTGEGGAIKPPSRSGSRHRRCRPHHSGESPAAAAASPFAKDTGSCLRRSSSGERMHCASHPLDGTPTSLRLPHGRPGSGLVSGWPSSGRLHTVSSESTWLLGPCGGGGANAAAAGGASDSEWSELHHAAVARRLTWRSDADDSDSDSEFWGDLARRVAAQRHAPDGLPRLDSFLSLGTPASDGGREGAKGSDANSLAFSAAMAAAQHPVFDLGNPEEAVMAQNAALYHELLQ